MAISVYQLKTKFQGILRPLTNFLAKIGVTANQVTVFAFLLSVAAGAAMGIVSRTQPYILLLLPAVLFVRMALNAIDGMLAREHDQKSKLGAILNELGDILSDVVLYIPLFWVLGVNVWLNMLIALLYVISETCGIMGVQIGASRRYDGPMGKSDRAFWFSMLAITVLVCPEALQYLDYAIYFVIFLLVLTTFNRLKNALKEEVE